MRAHSEFLFKGFGKDQLILISHRVGDFFNRFAGAHQQIGGFVHLIYEDIATGKVYTGAALMKAGLPLPLTTGDYQPIKFTFRVVEK